MNNILKEMLLIEEASVFKLYQEMMNISSYFIAPVFTIALILEYFGELNFGAVVKKLLLVTVFMSAFYQIHTEGVKVSLDTASYTLKKVSPRNLFVKKWYEPKVKTKEKKEWSFIESIAVPNLNDLLATAFFLLSKIFIWLLKLIYSSVYHLTYVFSGVTSVLYFLGWTKDSLKGTVQASLWCFVMPFVIVAILALVGNSIEEKVLSGEILFAKIDTIIWLFGITLLLLMSPMIAYGLIRGDGIHSFGSKMGSLVVASGMKAMSLYPMLAAGMTRTSGGLGKLSSKALLEPSIKELLQGANPDLKKMQELNKKGGLKNPLKPHRPLEERLQELGLTKDEAVRMARLPVKPQKENKDAQPKTNQQTPSKKKSSLGELKPLTNTEPPEEAAKLKKQNFKFNQQYWDNINPHKAEAIKKKYGIDGNTVDPHKVHRPVKNELKPHPKQQRRSNKKDINNELR